MLGLTRFECIFSKAPARPSLLSKHRAQLYDLQFQFAYTALIMSDTYVLQGQFGKPQIERK